MPPVSMEDLEIEELLKRYKKRDLVQTYFFKMACRVFGPPKSRDRIIIAPPMHVINKTQRDPVEGLRRLAPTSRKTGDTAAVMSVDSPAQQFTSFPAEDTASQEWVGERRAFRKMLNGVGNVRQWINNKPTVTDLELKVAEREASVRKGRPSVGSEPHLSPVKSLHPIICETPTLRARDPREVGLRKHLRGRESLILEMCSQLDTRGTGRLTRRDLRALFEKTGMKVSEERLEALMAALGCDGGSVTVAELAAGIQTWTEGGSRDAEGSRALAHLHTLTHTLLQRREELDRIYHHQRRKNGMLLDEEVLAILRSGDRAQDANSSPSSLGGAVGHLVDRYRRQCLGEYLDTLEQNHKQHTHISQHSMQRVLLHPGDLPLHQCVGRNLRQAGSAPLSGCGGRLRGGVTKANGSALKEEKEAEKQEVEEDEPPKKVHRERRKHSTCRADPSAFWPGREDHVRLYLPQVGIPPERTLFQHITRDPAPSPGAWPVNERGYSTCGDVDAHRAYVL